jgi:hypothetical protein
MGRLSTSTAIADGRRSSESMAVSGSRRRSWPSSPPGRYRSGRRYRQRRPGTQDRPCTACSSPARGQVASSSHFEAGGRTPAAQPSPEQDQQGEHLRRATQWWPTSSAPSLSASRNDNVVTHNRMTQAGNGVITESADRTVVTGNVVTHSIAGPVRTGASSQCRSTATTTCSRATRWSTRRAAASSSTTSMTPATAWCRETCCATTSSTSRGSASRSVRRPAAWHGHHRQHRDLATVAGAKPTAVASRGPLAIDDVVWGDWFGQPHEGRLPEAR